MNRFPELGIECQTRQQNALIACTHARYKCFIGVGNILREDFFPGIVESAKPQKRSLWGMFQRRKSAAFFPQLNHRAVPMVSTVRRHDVAPISVVFQKISNARICGNSIRFFFRPWKPYFEPFCRSGLSNKRIRSIQP